MRILVVADVHGQEAAIKTIGEQIKRYSPDLVLVCGDISQFGPPEWARTFLDKIPVRTMALPGNCDPEVVVDSINESKAILLHKQKNEMDGLVFVGLGGSNPTPFGTLFEFTEDEIFMALDDIMVEGAILVVHAPSKGHLDGTPSAQDLGSQAISDIVKKYSPPLVISAHIHEARGVEREGGTTYVNPGPASKGYAAVIDISDEIMVELIQN
jgi:Icc-related predicted phosphoesterase